MDKQQSDFLKLIAIVAMTIDHIGIGFYSDVEMLRSIGRVAFPLFAFQVALGYINTTNIRRYLANLLLFAIVSQYFYFLYFNNQLLNIIFTLFLGVLAIFITEKINVFLGLLFVLTGELLGVSYGAYGVFLVLLFYVARNNYYLLGAGFFLSTFVYSFYAGSPIQIYAVLALFVIYIKDWLPKINLPKYFFYWYYPGHLALLFIFANYY